MDDTTLEGRVFQYQTALDTRNFEITLFWQRCNYFLVLNSALAIGFFNLQTPGYAILLASLGIIASILWFAVSLGSKFWQSRWEQRLREVENRLAPELTFFAADRVVVRADVEQSLALSEHGAFRRRLDRLVLCKPSVSFMMTLLSLVFILAWGVALVLFCCGAQSGCDGI